MHAATMLKKLFTADCCIFAAQQLEVGWLFNGTSTQKGQFMPTAGRATGSVG